MAVNGLVSLVKAMLKNSKPEFRLVAHVHREVKFGAHC
jgi:hypothetical protein